MTKPHVLIIMDGWALNVVDKGNAVTLADTPNFDRYWVQYPHTQLAAFGPAVGLPDGAMGGSEVGHLNLGAGRVVYQDLTFINKQIKDGAFQQNEKLLAIFNHAKENGTTLHLMGLCSDGGVHSDYLHLKALIQLADAQGIESVRLHLFLDGRDVSPTSAETYLTDVIKWIADKPAIEIATLSGRFYAMDRDTNWDRTQLAFDAMTKGVGNQATDAVEALKASYAADVSDEFVIPTVFTNNGSPIGSISDGDALLLFNFRADRSTQLSLIFSDDSFSQFGPVPDVKFLTMTKVGSSTAEFAFSKDEIVNTLGEYLASSGKTQLRTAETEKFNHVTFFFNGGQKEPNKNEERILIPSPKVATYDLQPEMSAYLITDAVLKELENNKHDFILINYANADMVAHTGSIPATQKSVEVVDECVGKIVERVLELDGVALVTADHGNADQMFDLATIFTDNPEPWTAHSLHPVPFILISSESNPNRNAVLSNCGALCDVAPTLLTTMGLDIPVEMTGKSLIVD